MGKEVEFKIPISLENFGNNVLGKIESNPKFVRMNDITFKRDAYFSSANDFTNDGKVIRLRKDAVHHNVILPETFDARRDLFIKQFTTSNYGVDLKHSDIYSDFDLHFYLTRKIKRVVDGNEINDEYETEIADDVYDNIYDCFSGLGHKPYFRKIKTAVNVVFDQDDPKYHYELVSVNRLIYLECEYVGNKFDNLKLTPLAVPPLAIMEKMCSEIGLDPSNKDVRPWKDIIKQ